MSEFKDQPRLHASASEAVTNNVRVEVSRAAIVGYQGQEPVGEALSQGSQS